MIGDHDPKENPPPISTADTMILHPRPKTSYFYVALTVLLVSACTGPDAGNRQTSLPALGETMPLSTQVTVESSTRSGEGQETGTVMPTEQIPQQPTEAGNIVLEGEMEIFPYWREVPQPNSLAAIEQSFINQYPGVEIFDATQSLVPGSNPEAVLMTRMQAADPPDILQDLGGRSSVDRWSPTGILIPATSIIESDGGSDVFPEGLLAILSEQGDVWGVPLGIHRSNLLWYNKRVFSENNLNPPGSFRHFFEVAEALQEEEIIPLALGDNRIWAATHLLETVLLGELGGEAYRGLWTGETAWESPEVTDALETFVRMLDYTNIDHSALTWDQAAQLVADGDAAMTIMGDWAFPYFEAAGLDPNLDFGWIPTPGTQDDFLILADISIAPVGSTHPELARAWLEFAGSPAGQQAYNLENGSIPARLDTDPSLYNEYQQSAMADLSEAEISPSLVHGAAAPQGWIDAINDVMTLFIVDRDVRAAQNSLILVCEGMSVCQ